MRQFGGGLVSVVPCGRTDVKIAVVAFRSFANAPKTVSEHRMCTEVRCRAQIYSFGSYILSHCEGGSDRKLRVEGLRGQILYVIGVVVSRKLMFARHVACMGDRRNMRLTV